MPFLDEIAGRLQEQNVGQPGTVAGLPNSIYISSKATIPAGPGPYLQLNETGGGGSSRTHNDTATEHPTAQIVARATTYPLARAILQAAYDALGGAVGLYNVTLDDTFYLSINARQGPTDMGLDGDPSRVVVTFNIEAERVPS